MGDLRAPVERSPLSQQGISLNDGTLTLEGGAFTNINDVFRPATKAKNIINMHQLKRGVFSSPGNGWTRRAAALNAGAKILDYGVFINSSGYNLLVQAGSKVQYFDTVANTAGDITGLTGLSTTKHPCMRPYSPSTSTTQAITVYCNGDIEPRKITSTTVSAALLFNSPGVWPGAFAGKTYSKPKFCTPVGDRMLYLGFPGTDTFMDFLISDQGNAEKFTLSTPPVATDAYAGTLPVELGPPTGCTSYKLNNDNAQEITIIGCANGMVLINGTDATNYKVTIATRSHGLVSNRVFVNIDNEVYYLATDGIRPASALALNLTVQVPPLTREIHDRINSIDPDYLEECHATHHPYAQEIQFWVPYIGDGGQCKHAIIANYNTTSGDPIFYFKEGTAVASSIEFKRLFLGGGYDGLIQQHYLGDFYDAGQAAQVFPTFSVTFALVNIGNVAQSCSNRLFTAITDGGAQKFKAQASCLQVMEDGSTQKAVMQPSDFTLTSSGTPGAVFPLVLPFTFAADHPALLGASYEGQGRLWEVTFTGNESDMKANIAGLHYIMSVGGIRQ